MNRIFKKIVIAALGSILLIPVDLSAGNKDRAGSAGATHLLINPWSRNSGWGGANSAIGRGLESTFMNVAGLAFTEKTELLFSHSQWLVGSGININAFGFSQKLGENSGVLGISVNSMSFGDIPITTVNQPEGTNATFSPNYLNIGISYAKSFSQRIHGGVTARILSESIADLNAQGFALDAGIQYITSLGEGALNKDNFSFGIALKNIGPKMQYAGDGLAVANVLPNGVNLTQQQRSSDYEMPALMNIGIAYKQRFNEENRLSYAFNFTTNSFTRDQFIFGLEYGWKETLMLRAGYTYEQGIFDSPIEAGSNLLNAFTGPSAGFTFETPLGKTKEEKERSGSTKFGIDYSYRFTHSFGGVHSIGARISI
jgi:hypothetical protein